MIEKREFVSKDLNGNEIKLYVRRPTVKEISEGEFIFKTAKSKAIRQGFMTVEEADRIMRERGIWTEEKDKEIEVLFRKIEEKNEKLSNLEDVEVGKKIVDEITELRLKVTTLQMPRFELMLNTANAYADEVRTHFYISKCTYLQEGGERVYKSMDDVLEKGAEPYTGEAVSQVIFLMSEIDSFDDKKPELMWLKKHN